MSNDHKLSEADKYPQSARTRWNRPIRHQESDGKSHRTDTANYGPKAPTQWTSQSGASPEIAEELYQMYRAHQHDGESRSHGALERTTRAPGHQPWFRKPLDNLEGNQPVAYTGWPVKSEHVRGDFPTNKKRVTVASGRPCNNTGLPNDGHCLLSPIPDNG